MTCTTSWPELTQTAEFFVEQLAGGVAVRSVVGQGTVAVNEGGFPVPAGNIMFKLEVA